MDDYCTISIEEFDHARQAEGTDHDWYVLHICGIRIKNKVRHLDLLNGVFFYLLFFLVSLSSYDHETKKYYYYILT